MYALKRCMSDSRNHAENLNGRTLRAPHTHAGSAPATTAHGDTGWALRFRTSEEEDSPVHACIFISPLCYFRFGGSLPFSACRRRGSSAGRTRRRWCHWMTLRSGSVHSRIVYAAGVRSTCTDARSWRFRCRVMETISLVTYVPLIVFVAIFA
jgi:hypothetical protein